MARKSDDTRSGARNLGVLGESKTARGSLRFSTTTFDIVDYFKFKLSSRSSVSLTLSGLKSDANLRLLDSTNQVITTSTKRGKKAESIAEDLDAGDYFIQVNQNDFAGNKYILKASAGAPTSAGPSNGSSGGSSGAPGFTSPTPSTPADPGNIPATAFDTGRLSGVKAYRNTVGGADVADYYRFTVDKSSKVTISTGNVTGGSVNTSLVYDINGNEFVDQGDVIATNEVITKALGAGTYFIGVTPTAGSNVDYTIKLEESAVTGITNAADPPLGLGGATDLGAILGNKSVKQVVSSSDATNPQLVGTFDSTDIYKFSLNSVSNFSALLNSSQLTGDVTMSLIYDDGNPANGGTEFDDRNGIANPGKKVNGLVLGGDFIGGVFTGSSEGGSALSINKTLGAGTYYLGVTQRKVTDNTTYDLNLFVNNTVKGISPIPEPNDGVTTAFNVGALTQNVNYKQFVGSTDTSDFYRFTLTQDRNIIIRYNGTPELVALRLGADLNNDGFLGLGEDKNNNGEFDIGEDLNGNGKLDREIFDQQLYGDVVYNPLPPFHNSESKFEYNPSVNGFFTTAPTDIYAKLSAGTYIIQVDAQATEVDLGDGLARYGSANVLYNLSFMLDG